MQDLARYFGPAIRCHRERLRLSQEGLAEKAGLDRTYVSGVERGVRNPTLKVAQQFAVGLGVGLDVIFATARKLAREKSKER